MFLSAVGVVSACRSALRALRRALRPAVRCAQFNLWSGGGGTGALRAGVVNCALDVAPAGALGQWSGVSNLFNRGAGIRAERDSWLQKFLVKQGWLTMVNWSTPHFPANHAAVVRQNIYSGQRWVVLSVLHFLTLTSSPNLF